MANQRKRQTRKLLTLATLEELYFADGYNPTKAAFERVAGQRQDWAVIKPGQGVASRRTDLPENSGITYDDYSPPPLWQSPYVVQLATLAAQSRKDFVHHAGEEIAVPVEGKIRFHFFWSSGGKKPTAVRLPDLSRGSVLRLNPEVPHHAWAVNQPAKTWLFFRHASDSEAAISTARIANTRPSTKPHGPIISLTADDLRKPGCYALIAWGLASKLKNYRERADLRIKQVADACGIDHAHLSRIENGETNISVDTLLRLARYLKVDIGEFFSGTAWFADVEPITELVQPFHRSAAGQRYFRHPNCKHFLHGSVITLLAQERKTLSINHETQGAMSSRVVLSGKLLVELGGTEELLATGAVLHLRGHHAATIQALEDCVLIEVTYSSRCTCNSQRFSREDDRS